MKNNRTKLSARIRQKGFFVKLPILDHETYEYASLYRAVLDITLSDIIRDSNQPEEQEELDNWLDLNNQDFCTICSFSQLSAEFVYNTFQYIIENAETINGDTKWKDIIQNILQ